MEKKVRVFCTAEKYDSSALYDSLGGAYKVALIKDAIVIDREEAYAFIFDYGVTVLWGVGYEEEKRLMDAVAQYAIKPLKEAQTEEMSYRINEGAEVSIRHDKIELPECSLYTMLALSHAMAQSTKLAQFESSVQEMIEATDYIPQTLARTGLIPLNRKRIAKERGRLYLEKSGIMLQFGLLDTPEFIWEYPELESYYHTTARYLEVTPRIEALGKKLEIIRELLEMLADEQNHKHSSLLEWIIIVLIAFEIVLFFFD